jgi:hypothetical protein
MPFVFLPGSKTYLNLASIAYVKDSIDYLSVTFCAASSVEDMYLEFHGADADRLRSCLDLESSLPELPY